MSDGNKNIFHHWLPDEEIDFAVVLSHGMTEHSFRYDDFGKFLSQNRIALYAEDHRGHGRTADLAVREGTGMFGYLADKDGFFRVVDDIKEEIELVKKRCPGKKVVLFGHSFGSFIAQCYIEKYGDTVDAVILCGTAGPRPVVCLGKPVTYLAKRFIGKKKISPLLEKFIFGSSYNGNWLTRDEEIVKKTSADPWCTFHCTIGFYADMISGLVFIHSKRNMKRIPAGLPVFFISGDADPVGIFGKSVKKLFKIYQSNGMKSIAMKMYSGAKHELLNEINKDEVKKDVLSWMKEALSL
ncbi:MAG: lysophospholipase [Treponema sp.]|nr:lysophospholipase [Treponema sp.]